MSNNEESYIVPLKKRKSPPCYRDGFSAGLKAAREAVDKVIASYEETRQLLESSQNVNLFEQFESQIREEKNEIKELKALLLRAADALQKHDEHGLTDYDLTGIDVFELIAELRDKAE